jgi:hypothetical protein
MPILGTIASSRLTTPVPTTAFYQIATVQPVNTTVTFSSIPQGYDHLQIHGFFKDNRNPVYSFINVRFNGDSGSNYNYAAPQIDSRTSGPFASNAVSTNSIDWGGCPGNSGTQFRGAGILRIFDYSKTNKFKTINSYAGYSGFGDGTSEQGILFPTEGIWVNTSAITSISIQSAGSAFVAGSRFSLYGIGG